jgi:DNA replication protein DnaD
MSEYTIHRKFVHDIANELAIVEGGVKFALRQLPDELKASEMYEGLESSQKHIKECINKLKEYRTFIHQQEKMTNQS